MITLSQSSISDYLACSQRYKYRLTMPEEAHPTQEMSVGNIVHKALEMKWGADRNDRYQFTMSLASEYNIDISGIDRINECLLAYDSWFVGGEVGDLYRRFSDNDLCEYYFKEKLYDDVYINGKIDRIVTDGDIVIDWKTGSTQRTYLGTDIQSILYYMMYNKIFGKYPQVMVVNLLKQKLVAFQPNKKYIDTLMNSIIPMIVYQIKNKVFYKEGYFNYSCRNCPYIGICDKDS